MEKKKIGGIISICVIGIIGLIFLYLIGFFDGEDNQSQNTDNNTVTTAYEITDAPQSAEKTDKTEAVTEGDTEEITTAFTTESVNEREYKFRNKNLLNQHYEKHGKDMGFKNAEEYEKAASAVVNNPDALHKIEAEDGDDIYYIEATNEFVVVSTDGYIRTYFLPDRGIDYFNKQ